MIPTTDGALYTGSGATVVRRGRTTVVLSDAPAGAARAVWAGLTAESPVTAVLDALASLPGTSLTTLPPFAAVTVSGDGTAHVLVRGRFRARLATAAGDVTVDGADVSTWNERRVPAVASVVLGAGTRGAAVLLADPDAWPLVEGVAAGDEVVVEVVPGATTAPAPQPGPEAQPVPAPQAADAPQATDAQQLATPPALVLAVPEVETLMPSADDADAPEVVPDPDPEPVPAHEAEEPEQPAPAPAADPVDAPEATQAGPVDVADDGYAHLWGSTVLRTVEDAAVRPDEDDEDEHEGAPAVEPPAAVPAQAAPSPVLAPVAAPASSGLIAGIPRDWSPAPTAPEATAAPAAPAAARVAEPEAPQPAPPGPPPSDDDIDHDGHTIMSSELAALRSGTAPEQQPADAEAPPVHGPQVLALACVHGHPNPPSRVECRTCGAPLEGEATLAVRPVLGRVQVAGGPLIALDRPVVVGRRPRSPRSAAGEVPRLVTVASPNQDVSRSHVEVRLEGWHVLVTDLATTNGTVLHRGGQSPQRLHPGEATLVVDGDVVDLGDGATLTFEEIW